MPNPVMPIGDGLLARPNRASRRQDRDRHATELDGATPLEQAASKRGPFDIGKPLYARFQPL